MDDDHQRVLKRLRGGLFEPYQLGLRYSDSRLIPPNLDRCIPMEAGPVTFLVEARHLDNAAVAMATNGEIGNGSGTPTFDEHGATVHVLGAADGLEYLRFDCFEDMPHYHYVNHRDGVTTTVRIDQHAEGNPRVWAVARLRERLAGMLDYAGASDLARRAEQEDAEIQAVVDEVEKLMLEAEAVANAERTAS
jgi:hypothetical protein